MNSVFRRSLASCMVAISISFLFASCTATLPEEIELAYQSLPEKVDFNFHIKPILVDRCYSCHGPDENTRETDFRLDIEEEAFAKLKTSGNYAFVRGNRENSQAWERIISDDPEFQMPPPTSTLSLSNKEKALISKWLEQGAEWKEHWAFIPPKKQEIPEIEKGNIRNPIDNFVLAKLPDQGLTASPEAGKERLIRRLSMDLTGLPPSLEEIDDFLADTSHSAYEKQVDRLLQTDAHAERMTMEWLDIARYGDTQGMHTDAERRHWPWRDWVISAFQQNMPYDDFITWQLAGDLLPHASKEQILATAFHRNHATTSEGGVPDEEFRQKYVQDRTNTTATAFMGLTLECATCHDHKFDPISQKEYYQMTAFFNNMKEIGMLAEYGVASGPVMLLPEADKEGKLKEVSDKLQQAYAQRSLTQSQVKATQEYIHTLKNQGLKIPRPAASFPFESMRPFKVERGVIHRSQNNRPIDKIVDNNPKSLASGDLELVPGKIGKALRSRNEVDIVYLKEFGSFEMNEPYTSGGWIFTEKEGENQTIMGTSGEMGNAWRGWDFYLDSLNRPSVKLVSHRPHNYLHVRADVSIPKNDWHQVYFTYDGSAKAKGIQLYVNGKKVNTHIEYDHLYRSIIRKWRVSKEWKDRPIMVFRSGRFHVGENGVFKGSLDELKIFNQALSPLELASLYAKETQSQMDWESFKKEDFQAHYLAKEDDTFIQQSTELQKLLKQNISLLEDVPEIMVMADMKEPRETFVLNRGQYDEPTEQVFPGTPKKVLDFSDELPQNRLGLAKWLTDPKNPLTARVTVNRYWQMIFGRGIVETAHDFGTQGALPTHPELLDYLALDFVDSGWDLKALLKKLVMSATYRQSSVTSPELQEKDPFNQYLSRAPSYRLQAEMIRDNALAASGLLSPKLGGKSVKPYQPEGVWDFGALVSGNYHIDTAENLYRRSMYTYIRRTSPHPAMLAFDAPDRLVCTAKRENTNTPLQALVLLNDPQFVEAARVLAERMREEGGDQVDEQMEYGFRLLCGRAPNSLEQKILQNQYDQALAKFQKDPKRADELLNVGDYQLDKQSDKIETAALAMVSNMMMSFDEVYMKR